MEWLKKARLRLKFVQFISDPTKTELVFEIIAIAKTLNSSEQSIQKEEAVMLANPQFKKMWEDKWIPETPSMEFLKGCPKESLGYAYYKHLDKNNLSLEFFPKVEIKRAVDYASYRMYHAHDLWHVILGHDVSPSGEIAVQGFGLGQFGSPIAAMLISGGILNLLDNNPEIVPEAFEGAVTFYRKGKSAEFFLGFKLEEMLELDLHEVRAKLGV